MMQRLFFRWRYWRGQTPWDTYVTPPEVTAWVAQANLPRGRALDLGCGSGTNAIYLAQQGFETVGIDFVPRAIERARARARAANVTVEFRCADVLKPGTFAAPFDFLLDIGCLHNFGAAAQTRYAANARQWTKPGATLLLYAFFPHRRGARNWGLARADVEALFARAFDLRHYADDGKSAWYEWQRKQDASEK